MASSADLFRDLVHAGLDNWTDRNPTDNISNHNALFRKLKEKGNIKTMDGGIDILVNVILRENTTLINYQGYDPLNIGASEVTEQAKFQWSQKAMFVSASGRELNVNRGKSQMYDLVDTKIEAAHATGRNHMAIEAYSDGSIADGIQGLDALVTNDGLGTVGGIDSNLYMNWKNNVVTYGTSTVNSTNIRNKINQLWIRCKNDGDEPDLIVLSNDLYVALEDATMLQAQYPYPYNDRKEANAGFMSLRYKNAAVIHDANVNFAENNERGYMLNTDYIYLFEHPKARWEREEGRKPVNVDAVHIPMFWMGGMAIKKRRAQGRLNVA